jgi:hypothetical protein
MEEKNIEKGAAVGAGVTGAQTAATAAGWTIPLIGTLPGWVIGLGGLGALYLGYKVLKRK